jgi:hypothetical protein
MSRRLRLVQAAMLAVACLAVVAVPVFANTSNSNNCCCQGIDIHGCLTNSGCCPCYCPCVCNTKCGTFTGYCKCCVQNCCKKAECYKNCWFLSCHGYSCSSSCYNSDCYGNCNYSCGGNYSA